MMELEPKIKQTLQNIRFLKQYKKEEKVFYLAWRCLKRGCEKMEII